jgi:RHS repeat-associated protein
MGVVVWHATSDAFGARVDGAHPVVQNLGFPGQYWDRESGLFYNRHRHYDPFAARYVQPDPLGVAAGWNPYAYPSDPLSFSDRSGLAPTYRVARRDESKYLLLSRDPALVQLKPLNARADEPNINWLGGSMMVCAGSGHGVS